VETVTIAGVAGDWVPATSVQPLNDTTQPGAANTGSLLFYDLGEYVNINVERVSNPQSVAEQAMAIVLNRL